MSLRFRLIGLVCLILFTNLAFGGVIACRNASRSVRTEMQAALLVGRQTIENAVERLQNAANPTNDLRDLIASFKGNRHLRVWLIGDAAAVAHPSVEKSPFGGVPFWFTRLVAPLPVMERVSVAVGGHNYGTVAVQTDPHNELIEVWREFADSVATQAAFYGLTLLLIFVFIGRALRPLGDLAAALEEVGDGRYRTRVRGRLAPELSRLRDSFNRMTAHLTASDAENRQLNEQLLTLQEQERNHLARDLHDEVSPYLFAISVDAGSASRLLQEGRSAEACGHLHAIADAVRHLQRQVRTMLGRLRPIGFTDAGLSEAIEEIAAFWRRRCPAIRYQVAVSADCEGLGVLVSATICRIVQECLSNAVRHAEPALIMVSVDRDGQNDCDQVRVEVADDGRGMQDLNRIRLRLARHQRARQGARWRVDLFEPYCRGLHRDGRSPMRARAGCGRQLGAGRRALKILIVDDHPIVRAGLRRLLAGEAGTEVREASDGKEALGAFREDRPALVILDLNLPGLGGLEVIARLKIAEPDARILILSMHEDEIHVTRALRAGAAGYVSKNAPPDQILEAIRRVANGDTYIEYDIAERLVFSNIRDPSRALEHLSSRDLEILRLLAAGRSLLEIADIIGISYKTAANNCSQIKAKLGAVSTADLIRIAIRYGLTDQDAGALKLLSGEGQ